MADTPNPLPPAGIPVLDGANNLTLPWRRALQTVGQSASGGITQLTGDVLAGPGGGVQAAELSPTGVTPGAYVNPDITINASGRITHAANGAAAATQAGFGFEVFGIFGANELLGFASWPVDVAFTADADSYFVAFPSTPATADAVFRFMDETLTVQGLITVLAGERLGAITWTTDPYTHPANAPLLVYAPVTPDATLGNANALIVGAIA